MATISRALISVSDKSGLAPFAQGLAAHGIEILSTGGTAKFLQDAGVQVIDVSQFTGFPEIMDGRVKTLHPKVHGGLLNVRGNDSHQQQMQEHGLSNIDMLVVNLYPFEAAVAKPGCTLSQAIENIDIGGPSMLRSAAKNHKSVTVVTDPDDYDLVLGEMKANAGSVTLDTNSYLALKVFARTAAYDAAISNWLSSLDKDGKPGKFPEYLTVQYKKQQEMRYGENPHQDAAFYKKVDATDSSSITQAKQLQGKELSFNNIHDANGAYELVKEFNDPAVVVVKHTNPCGAAVDSDLLAAYQKARDTDPTSSFGGIIACNREVTGAMATEISTTFVEAVISPGFADDAIKVLKKKKNLRLLVTPELSSNAPAEAIDQGPTNMDMKRVVGGLLLQESDKQTVTEDDLKVVTKRAPTKAEMKDLLFAWKVVKHVKSNAIVFVKDLCTVGVGAGQMSRVDSSRIAVWKARETAKGFEVEGDPVAGTVLASDAFFPFADGVEAAAEAGATAVIQPGGSMRDQEVIDAADKAGLAMVFTGFRHFKH
jgi:phosphoribosylaminoimidazolecarboxamide formyltransferase / IMP cyclohydrolase